MANLSAVEALILLSCHVHVHGLALSTKDYPRPGLLILLGWLRTRFVSDYRVAEEVSASLFKAKLFLLLFMISGDMKDDVLVLLVRGWLRLCSDDLMDILVEDSLIQEIDELLI